jgi:hypothetical protein
MILTLLPKLPLDDPQLPVLEFIQHVHLVQRPALGGK